MTRTDKMLVMYLMSAVLMVLYSLFNKDGWAIAWMIINIINFILVLFMPDEDKKSVYQVTLVTEDGTWRNQSFYKGTAWDAIDYGVEEAKKKTKKEKKKWNLDVVKEV